MQYNGTSIHDMHTHLEKGCSDFKKVHGSTYAEIYVRAACKASTVFLTQYSIVAGVRTTVAFLTLPMSEYLLLWA